MNGRLAPEHNLGHPAASALSHFLLARLIVTPERGGALPFPLAPRMAEAWQRDAHGSPHVQQVLGEALPTCRQGPRPQGPRRPAPPQPNPNQTAPCCSASAHRARSITTTVQRARASRQSTNMRAETEE